MRRPPLVASQSRPSATTAIPCVPGGTERREITCGDWGLCAPMSTLSFPVAASAAAPAPTRNVRAKTRMSTPPRERRAAPGPRAPSAAARERAVASRPGFGRRANIARNRCSSSADIVHLVIRPELLERACQAGVHGPGRDSEQLADRGRRVAEPVAQDDDDPALQREPGDRVEQLLVAAGDVVPFEALELGVAADEAPLGPEQVKATVDDDPMEPRPKRAALVEAAQRCEGSLECILRDVVCELAPPG